MGCSRSQRSEVRRLRWERRDSPGRSVPRLRVGLILSRCEARPEGVVVEAEPGVAGRTAQGGSGRVRRIRRGVLGWTAARASQVAGVQARDQVTQGVQGVVVLVQRRLALAL